MIREENQIKYGSKKNDKLCVRIIETGLLVKFAMSGFINRADLNKM